MPQPPPPVWHMIFLRMEIQNQCLYARHAGEEIDRATSDGDTERLWFGLQTLLVAAGNLSKLLWGKDGKNKDRAELREQIGVDDTSVLKDRDLRNDFEHFDSRLDTWLKGAGTGMATAPPYRMLRYGEDSDDLVSFQYYNPETGLLAFSPNRVTVPELRAEIERIARQPGTQAFSDLRQMVTENDSPALRAWANDKPDPPDGAS